MRLDAGPARVFSLLEALDLDTSKCIPLQHICYVAYGMRLNATDKFSLGQVVEVPKSSMRKWGTVSDPLVQAVPKRVVGMRRPPPPTSFGRDWVSGEVWLSGSTDPSCSAVPGFVPKLLIGKFSGAYWDEGARIGHVAASDGLTLAVRWCEMKGVEDPGLNKEIRATHVCRAQLEERSQDYSLGYLLALYLSAPVKLFIESKADMKKNIYPGLIKEIPVPAISHSEQIPFVTHAKRLQELAWRLYDLRREGVRITASGKVTVPVATWTARILEQNPRLPRIDLFQASATLFEFPFHVIPCWGRGGSSQGRSGCRIRPGIESREVVVAGGVSCRDRWYVCHCAASGEAAA